MMMVKANIVMMMVKANISMAKSNVVMAVKGWNGLMHHMHWMMMNWYMDWHMDRDRDLMHLMFDDGHWSPNWNIIDMMMMNVVGVYVIWHMDYDVFTVRNNCGGGKRKLKIY